MTFRTRILIYYHSIEAVGIQSEFALLRVLKIFTFLSISAAGLHEWIISSSRTIVSGKSKTCSLQFADQKFRLLSLQVLWQWNLSLHLSDSWTRSKRSYCLYNCVLLAPKRFMQNLRSQVPELTSISKQGNLLASLLPLDGRDSFRSGSAPAAEWCT